MNNSSAGTRIRLALSLTHILHVWARGEEDEEEFRYIYTTIFAHLELKLFNIVNGFHSTLHCSQFLCTCKDRAFENIRKIDG